MFFIICYYYEIIRMKVIWLDSVYSCNVKNSSYMYIYIDKVAYI